MMRPQKLLNNFISHPTLAQYTLSEVVTVQVSHTL
jgi:hypothetical protein